MFYYLACYSKMRTSNGEWWLLPLSGARPARLTDSLTHAPPPNHASFVLIEYLLAYLFLITGRRHVCLLTSTTHTHHHTHTHMKPHTSTTHTHTHETTHIHYTHTSPHTHITTHTHHHTHPPPPTRHHTHMKPHTFTRRTHTHTHTQCVLFVVSF